MGVKEGCFSSYLGTLYQFFGVVNGRKSAEGRWSGPNPALTRQFRRAM